MAPTNLDRPTPTFVEAAEQFDRWEKIKDLIDQFIDIPLNYRQSGHPGGSRSKVHAFVSLLLSGAMRWDIRQPEKRFADRFVLVGGHTAPLVYATLAVFNEALRAKHERTGDLRYLVPKASERQLTWEDLTGFRRRGGLSGHAEMEGKTLFLKYNTGPSGHGAPAAAGEALALKLAGVGSVRVYAMDGEGGCTPGGAQETLNSAYGLGLDNLMYLLDWNDFGIDDQPISAVVAGTPREWFGARGWRVVGTESGSEWSEVARTIVDLSAGSPDTRAPSVAYFRTRKGRGYGVYDNKSHGVPHPLNSAAFWGLRAEFATRYGVQFVGQDDPAPTAPAALAEQFRANLKVVADVLRADKALVDYLADRLVELGDNVPEELPGCRIDASRNPWRDERIYDYERYPAGLFVAPGTKVANRAAFAKFGAWINAFGKENYDRSLFIASSADLAESTNIAGFGQKYGDFAGWGRYNRDTNPTGALLPQEITEFANAGIATGLATVNLASDPEAEFQGFYATTSTYGSFVYLMYGPMRLFSQMSQDSQIRLGKVLWVAGHSGPETADDSRTHFGIFEPGVTQLFPEGKVIDLHPWEHNEVPVVLGAALALDIPIVALHLTRPPIEVPDRAALGMPSHFAAAKGAYVLRDARPDRPQQGTVIVRGTSTTASLVKSLPEIDRRGLNVKVVAAISPQLYRAQSSEYRASVLSADERTDALVITNGARKLMSEWVASELTAENCLSPDFDDRWRTGGTLDEVIDEAHLSPEHIVEGIARYVERGRWNSRRAA